MESNRKLFAKVNMTHQIEALISKIHLHKRWLLISLLVFISMYIFLDLAGDVWLNEGFDWDVPIILAIHQFTSPVLDLLFQGITLTAGIFVVIPLAIACYGLWQVKQRYQMYTLIFSVVGMAVITNLLKLFFQRPRPDIFLRSVTEVSYSFPSGHTGSALALYGLLSIFLWRKNYRLASLFCWVWVILVMLSRIYLGAHYPSDVLASFVLGIIWITLLSLNNKTI